MPYDKTNPQHRAAVAARLEPWFASAQSRVPARAVNQWMAVHDSVFGKTGDEGRAIASAYSVVHRRFPSPAGGHAALLSPAVIEGGKMLAAVLGRKALRELELTLQNCDCGRDHARTLAMVQLALRAANAAVGNDSPTPTGHAKNAAPAERKVKKVGVNEGVVWNMIARDIYANGDKLFLAVREMMQNSRDARAKTIRIDWIPDDPYADGSDGTLVFEDDGTGMSVETVENKFLVLGESEKEEGALGGFGAAKAAILTASRNGWDWRLLTRNVLVESGPKGSYLEPVIVPPEDAIRGTRITIPGVAGADTVTPLGSGAPVQRIRSLVRLCDLRGLTVTVNDHAVEGFFAGRRGKVEEHFQNLSWGEIKPEIKSYARSEGRGGSIIIRVKGLAQFGIPEPHGAELKRDYVLDFEIPKGLTPHDAAYPFKAGRDAFRNGTRAWWAFDRFRDEVMNAAAKAEKDLGEYEEIKPDSTDPRERKAQAQFDDLMETVLGGDKFQATLADLAELSDEMLAATDEALRQGIVAPPNEIEAGDQPQGGHPALPPQSVPVENPNAIQMLFEAILAPELSDQLARIEAWAASTLASDDATGFHEAVARLRGRRGYADDLTTVVVVLKGVIARTAPSVSAIQTGALISRILTVLEQGLYGAYEVAEVQKLKARGELNPFGGSGCIFVSRERYGVEAGKVFRKGARKFMKHLVVWDFVVRAILHAAGTQARWPKVQKLGVGFVLDKEALGLCAEGGTFVMVNPHAFAQIAETYKDRPFVVAAWVHGVACHEIAHAMQIKSGNGAGHGEPWSIIRENLAAATLFLIDTIEDACAKLLKLKVRRRRSAPKSEANRIAELQRGLAEAKITVEDYKTAEGHRTRIFDRMNGLAHRLDHLASMWEFQNFIRNNPSMATAKGLTVDAVISLIQSPGAAEAMYEELERSERELKAEPLVRAGDRFQRESREAQVEAHHSVGHAACRSCGGTCGAVPQSGEPEEGHAASRTLLAPGADSGRLTVSRDLAEEWATLQIDGLFGGETPTPERAAFVDALRVGLLYDGPRVAIDLDADAMRWFVDPTGPVHGDVDIVAEAARGAHLPAEDRERSRRMLQELKLLARKFPQRGHAACGCGKRVLVLPSPHVAAAAQPMFDPTLPE